MKIPPPDAPAVFPSTVPPLILSVLPFSGLFEPILIPPPISAAKLFKTLASPDMFNTEPSRTIMPPPAE